MDHVHYSYTMFIAHGPCWLYKDHVHYTWTISISYGPPRLRIDHGPSPLCIAHVQYARTKPIIHEPCSLYTDRGNTVWTMLIMHGPCTLYMAHIQYACVLSILPGSFPFYNPSFSSYIDQFHYTWAISIMHEQFPIYWPYNIHESSQFNGGHFQFYVSHTRAIPFIQIPLHVGFTQYTCTVFGGRIGRTWAFCVGNQEFCSRSSQTDDL